MVKVEWRVNLVCLRTEKMIGTVKWFNESKGFGFIVSDNKDFFVHFKEIDTPGFKTLNEGDNVSFEPSTSAKGAIATKVRVERT
jgi:CspA family cold shock protein